MRFVLLIWILIIIAVLLCFEVILYALFLLIKALRIYIGKNCDADNIPSSTKHIVKRFIVSNAIICLLVIIALCSNRIYEIYNTRNVISFESQSDVEDAIQIFNKSNVSFKVFTDGKKIQFENNTDLKSIQSLLDDKNIDYNISDHH